MNKIKRLMASIMTVLMLFGIMPSGMISQAYSEDDEIEQFVFAENVVPENNSMGESESRDENIQAAIDIQEESNMIVAQENVPDAVLEKSITLSKECLGVKVSVNFDADAFEKEAFLAVSPVGGYTARRVDAAVDQAREESANVAESFLFDIKIVDERGIEMQPSDGKSVKVAFECGRIADTNLDTQIYHIETVGRGYNAESMDVAIANDMAVVETDGFSYYQVEFTYGDLEYIMPGDTAVPLSEILAVLGLHGNIEGAEVSNENLIEVKKNDDGVWMLVAKAAFTSVETLLVRLNGVEYSIKVTDEMESAVYAKEILPAGAPHTETWSPGSTPYKGSVSGFYYQAADHSDGYRYAKIYVPYGYNASDATKFYNVVIFIEGTSTNNYTSNAGTCFSASYGGYSGKDVLDYVYASGLGVPAIIISLDCMHVKDYEWDSSARQYKMRSSWARTADTWNMMNEIKTVLNYADSHYNTYKNAADNCACASVRAHRFLGGYSQGAGEALDIMGGTSTGNGLYNQIGYIGMFSPASSATDDWTNIITWHNASGSDKREIYGAYFSAGSQSGWELQTGYPNSRTHYFKAYSAGLPAQWWGYGSSIGHDPSNVIRIMYNIAYAAFDDCDCPPPIPGYAKVVKVSSDLDMTAGNSCYSLEGATYGIYKSESDANENRNAVATLVTNARGESNTVELVVGQYYAKEISAPQGYALDTDVHQFEVVAEETTTINVSDAPQNDPVPIILKKVDATMGEAGQTSGNMSLADAQFRVTFYGGQYSTAAAAEASGTQLRSWILKTDSDGYCDLTGSSYFVSGDALWRDSHNTVVLPLGTVIIQEITPPTGYLLNDTKYVVNITANGASQEVVETYAPPTVPEKAIMGGVKVQKIDREVQNDVQGDAGLAGGEFTIYNANDKSVTVNGQTCDVGAAVQVIVTDADGKAESGKTLPYGTYTIKETKAPDGYVVNEDWSVTFSISVDDQVIDANTCADDVARGGIAVQKLDKDTGEDHGPGGIPLKGAELTIINRSEKAVIVNGETVVPYVGDFDRQNRDAAGIAARIYTNDNGYAATDAHLLPYGTYEVFETKAPAGYMLGVYGETEPWHQTVEIREDGRIYVLNGDKSVVDELARLDIKFVKAGFHGNNQVFLANVVFRLTRVDETGNPVESHIVVTDPNGVFNSANQQNSNHTNGNDAAVSADGVIDESALNYQYGIWFGGGDPVDALPDGKHVGALIATPVEEGGPDWSKNYYILEELPCAANEGYVISDTINIKVYKSTTNNDEPYYVGMIHNTAPTMGTTLISNDTGGHQAQAFGRITLTDTIHFSGVKAGKTYSVKGVLVDKDSEQPIVINGTPVEARASFKPVSDSGTTRVRFTFDAEGLAGHTVVAFEYMYLGGMLISEHEDINDENQTVSFPKIRTVAETSVGGKELCPSDDMTIVDTVYYENLAAGYNYTIEGTLINAETGAVMKDAHGDPIKATETLHMADPDSPTSGSCVVTFNFAGGDEFKDGVLTVVYERLYINGNTVLAKHEEIDDENQSISIPSIKTTLGEIIINGESGGATHTMGSVEAKADLELCDIVRYTGLTPDAAYTVSGILYDRETGEPALDKNGEQITAARDFTAAGSSGVTEVTFSFDAEHLAGHVLVAVVEISGAYGVVASDMDLTNELETVWLPQIGTSAHDKDGNQELMALAKVKIIDDVAYESLHTGVKYTFHGVVMDKETGEALLDKNGNQITVDKEFTPAEENGTIKMEFILEDLDLAGKTLVVFETVYGTGGQVVASHEDLEDESQTIRFPKIGTSFVDEAEHHITIVGNSVLIDHVSYENLTPGKEYTVSGSLWLRNGLNGKKLKDSNGDQYTASTTFTPDDTGSGVVDLVFDVETSELDGEAVVAFEKVFDGDREIASHEDINDDDQHVRFPEIATSAADASGNKIVEIHHGEDLVIVDTVAYENLIPDVQYVISGVLRIKETGGVVKNADGDAIVVEFPFTPDAASGEIDVEFTIPYDGVQGLHLVAAETLMFDGSTIAVHDDLNDEAQTVFVPYEEEIFKYDASDRSPLPGAVFEITDITHGAERAVQMSTSDDDGLAYFVGLPGHEYSVKEVAAPDGYRLATNSEFFVTVGEDGSLTGDTEIPNIHGGTVVITKVDVITGEPVEGCEVTVYKVTEEIDAEATQKAIEAAAKAAHVKVKDFDASKVAPIMKEVSREEVFKQTTDKNGRIYFYTTEAGKYVYKETATRTGYYLNTDEYSFEIAEDMTVTGTVRFKNVPFGTVVLTKVDKQGKPLEGAEFAIYDATTDKFLGKGVSGKNGRVYFVSPGPGKYYFVETKAPEGYAIVEGRNHFEIASDYTVSGKVVLMNDRTGTQNKTGDTEHIGLWIAIASVAVIAAGCAVFFVVRRPKKKDEQK